MDDTGFIKSHFLGRDGFIWWIGQVVSEKAWAQNFPGTPTAKLSDHDGFDFRYKVRIMGYHTCNPEDLPDEELPWASVMLPVTAGVSGGAISTPNLRQGNFVYGFFLDGEDAQQPIIMGVIGYNQYTAILKDAPEDETCAFLPFSGYDTKPKKVEGGGVVKADKVSTSQNPTTQVSPAGTGGTAERVEPSKTNNNEVAESSVGKIGRNTGDQQEQYENEKEPVHIASSAKCEQAPMVGIQRSITNMNNKIHRYKKTLTDWQTKVSTTLPDGVEAEINKVKDNTTKEVSGHIKMILTEVLKNTTKKVNDSVSDSFDQVFPTELPGIYNDVMEANDNLSCVFKNIMKNLTGMVGGFLDKATDRMVTTPPCAINDMSGDLLGKVSGLVDDAVDKAMKPLQSTLSGMGVATDAISDVMGFTSDALSFLNCDEDPKCTDVKEWNSVNGAEPPVTFDMNELVGKARAAKEAFKAAAEAAGQIIDLDNFDFNLDFSDTFTKLGTSVGGCNVGPRECGPPTVEFAGGGGSGSKANAIISAVGTVLGIDIIAPGGGYTSVPKIIIKDACDKGRGAVATAVLGPVEPVGGGILTGDVTAGSPVITNVSTPAVIFTGTIIDDIATVISVVGSTVTLDRPLSDTGTVTLNYTSPNPPVGDATEAIGTYPPGTNLGVVKIIIEESGIDYLPSPDGSKGGSGRTWATPEESVVKRGGNFPGSDGIPGIYDVPHKPGEVVQLYPGDEFTPPGGATEIVTESKIITTPPLPPAGIKPGVFPSSVTGEYPIVLEIDDINIIDGGYGYDCSKDKVIVEPANGAELSIKCDPLGSIIGVDVINGGIGFTDDPLIYIESDTGYNVDLMPVFKVNRIGEDVTVESIAPSQIIQVIDCVGKFK